MEYRNITIDDVNDLSEIYVESFNSPPWNDKWTAETARKRLLQIINAEAFYGLCAYTEGSLCGMILGCYEQFFDGIMFSIKEFCVRNKLRGKGIGSAMLAEFEDRLKEQGVKEIILFTSKNDGTEGFYNKRGLESYGNMVMMGKHL